MPTQILNTYVGTTLRSMEEVLTDSSNSLTAYTAFIVQVSVILENMSQVSEAYTRI